ncbi:uncharacterized protein LOC134286220 [Aedes albopictus]|uniref:Helix-turn-helix domain-containing protein n=1 Tax=Aedes albopictus TaxID=7160 RepID=A0ABM1YTW5_AEDAL
MVFQNQNNTIVKRLQDLKLIDPYHASRLKTYKAVCPKIYGLPKAHKPGLPLRPVVPCMTAPTLMKQSIFKHWDEIKKHTAICLDLFWEVTEFCIDASYFVFEGTYYQQIFGTAMGSPLSPIIAEYVMEDLLDDAVAATTVVIPYLKKYVDDLFLALPVEKIEEVLNVLNQQNTNIQFTVEKEENCRLPFLDLLLVRQEDRTIKTEWYRKAISSGRFLNYHSGHPMSLKMNVAFNFAKRVLRFSTNLSLKKAKSIIFGLLRTNDYPSNIINRISGSPTDETAMKPEPRPEPRSTRGTYTAEFTSSAARATT